ncbi:S-adenosyl-L-methionine-dependent methyltransferase [Coniochaeta ligniaria NRRL 30616]|uniref:S-adenosyl-L-methionine-dependent methyltransferase n=1 Tax=Coniochaeta ligniaria NRRL 30616 TaxID=1408157 RepID=A0A1J7IP25_9PEZI|nr:S-adenosyl-L-methionine-dependent methyltransferase [Coniochaeta ligniaria NRRL 30616]
MLNSILSLTPDQARALDQYAADCTTGLSPLLARHYQWTRDTFEDADRASSLLQAQWMMQRAQERRATRVLDVGCYTGLSALAWYEATKQTGAEASTLYAAWKAFVSYGCEDRIRVVEARAEEALETLAGPFDLVFVDLEFSAYRPIVGQILDRGLLADNGIILVDNVFARGFVIGEARGNIDPAKLDHWKQSGQVVLDFNAFVAADPRVTVTIWPFFDGIAEIKLRGSERSSK